MPEHADIKYNHPGKCPICGMTLIPAPEDRGRCADTFAECNAAGTSTLETDAASYYRFFVAEQVRRSAGDAGARRWPAFSRFATFRSMRFPICPTRRSSSTPNGRARRRRSCRIRSLIRSRPRCCPCRARKWCAAIRFTASRSST